MRGIKPSQQKPTPQSPWLWTFEQMDYQQNGYNLFRERLITLHESDIIYIYQLSYQE